MKLRTRLCVIVLAVALPSTLALLALDGALQHRAAAEHLVGFARGHVEGDDGARCVEDPAAYTHLRPPPPPRHEGGPRRPPPGRAEPRPARMSVLDEQGRAPNGEVAIEAEVLRVALSEGVWIAPWRPGSRAVEVVVATGWHNPCALLLARGDTHQRWGAILPDNAWWLLPLALLSLSVLLALGPMVERIRTLTARVQALRERGYQAAATLGDDGDDEIAELGRAFDGAARTIVHELEERRRSEQALRDFLANTTHDVMIPLTVLQGHLTELRQAGLEHDVARVLRAAMDEAHYLGALLHNLALISTLESPEPKLHPSEVDLHALVERVVARHRPIATTRRIGLELALPDRPTVAHADVTVLEQAVSNLVYNAVKYNHADGHVAVVLENLESGRFRLSVIDDGPGIPSSRRTALLARGARSDEARTRAPEGHGLGLFIAARACTLHDFTLSLDTPDGVTEEGGLRVVLEGEKLAP